MMGFHNHDRAHAELDADQRHDQDLENAFKRFRVEARRRVARGVTMLDKLIPDWASHIQTYELDLASSEHCMIGQLARYDMADFQDELEQLLRDKRERDGTDEDEDYDEEPDYSEGIAVLYDAATTYHRHFQDRDQFAEALGFYIPDMRNYYPMSGSDGYRVLTEIWEAVVLTRQARLREVLP
jgi:hypothetical protein